MNTRVRVRRRRAGLAAVLALTVVAAGALGAGATTQPKAKATAPCMKPQSQPTAPAEATGALAIAAFTGQLGCIQLNVSGAGASSVTVSEAAAVPGGTRPLATLTTSSGDAVLTGITWSCEAVTRTFTVTEILAEGTIRSADVTVSTPACSDRLRASAPSTRLHSGYPAIVSIADRWGIGGIRVTGCLGSGHRHCASVMLRSGDSETPLRLLPAAAGTIPVTVTDPYQVIRLHLHVRDTRPVLLATGDSEMQVLDDDLSSDLSGPGGVRVIGDAHQSTAISSPFFFNWPAHAVGQVEGDHPDIVAMFLGGNEGFDLGGVACCGLDWSEQYADRVDGMMRLYLQHGAAAVYWFLIPTPAREPFVKVVRAVNEGIILAAGEFHHNVHVFDLRPIFSPGGRYIDTLRRDGRTITVHEPDGFHLSAQADVIVAHLFIDRLREDGFIE
jgi:hypothetical protein